MDFHNLYDNIPTQLPEELFTDILKHKRFGWNASYPKAMLRPEGFWYDQDQNEWVMVLELLRWNEVFADLIDYLKSREWKQAVSDIAGESEGGDERRQRLLDLRLAVVVYPAVRKANKTK